MSKGLITLKTDLKSLKYQGVNGSQPPFITKDINNPPSNSRIAQEVNSRIDDTVRVTKAILPTNSRFLENQAKLAQFDSEIKLNPFSKSFKESGLNFKKNLIQRVKETAEKLAKTSASTIAQTGVSGTGIRFGIGFQKVTSAEALQGETITPSKKLKDGEFVKEVLDGTIIYAKTSPLLEEVKTGTIDTGNKDIVNQNRTTTGLKNSVKLSDFRAKTPEGNKYNGAGSEKYIKEFRVGLGNQGLSPTSTDYTKTRRESVDKINALDVQNNKVSGTVEGRDLIKFKFEIITPEDSKFLYFRAYLDSLSDNFKGSWNETKYVGRAEAMQIYEGFSRDISFGFKIAASTRIEMEPLYRKMVYLASSTAPTYAGEGGFMRGTFARITIGSYLYEVPGVITSVDYKWDTNYPWEIAFQNPVGGTDDDMQELPQILDCSITFKPIHDFIPQTGLSHYITNPVTAGEGRDWLAANPGVRFVEKSRPREQSIETNISSPPLSFELPTTTIRS